MRAVGVGNWRYRSLNVSCWSRDLEVSELERELLEQGMEGNGAFVRRYRSGEWVMSERGRVESGAWGRSCRFAYIVELGR